jgi:hypothetical protein
MLFIIQALHYNKRQVHFLSFIDKKMHRSLDYVCGFSRVSQFCTSWTYNTVRVQEEGSTVCGHHCIFYLIHRCAGKSMGDVTRTIETPERSHRHSQDFCASSYQ